METQIQKYSGMKVPKPIRRNPIASLLTASALVLMALNAQGINRAMEQNSQQREAIGAANQALQTLQLNEQRRAELATIANSRYDKGCEMVFSVAVPRTYTAINPGEPVLDGSTNNTYLPAGAIVCDAYGNTAVLTDEVIPALGNQTLPVAREFASTQDKARIQQAMKPVKAVRPAATQN